MFLLYASEICQNKALTSDIGSVQLSFHTIVCVHPIHAKVFLIQMLLHFGQIAPRVCTLVLFIIIVQVQRIGMDANVSKINFAYTPTAVYCEEGGVWTEQVDHTSDALGMSCLCNCQYIL